MKCDVCNSALVRGLANWHFVCRGCGTECSTLQDARGSRAVDLDEPARARGLAPVRAEAYRLILSELHGLESSGGWLLEVGSGHGWFMELARNRYDKVIGIEPDDAVRTAPAADNVEARQGSFPRDLVAGEEFAVVVFNDVFEHIPKPRTNCGAIRGALRENGIVVINIPMRDGFVYRMASLLQRLGVSGPFERMWQKDFPSPHLYYFSCRSLQQLFAEHGFRCERVIAMPTIRLRGLWARIRFAQTGIMAAVVAYVAAVAVLPVLGAFPPDVRCFLFRKSVGEN